LRTKYPEPSPQIRHSFRADVFELREKAVVVLIVENGRGFDGSRHERQRSALSALTVARKLRRMTDADLLTRIVVNPAIFGGKPIVRGRRLAVEHVLGMLAAGDDIPTILEGYPWLEREDVLACIEYARQNWGRA
jgi:uncharacterized protein (DUF433 family)